MIKKQGNIRALIIEKAFELFCSQSYEDITVNDICMACKISRTSFYSVFSCKLDVFKAIEEENAKFCNLDSSEMLKMQNDFERAIYILSKHAISFKCSNVQYCKTLMSLELNNNLGFFDMSHAYNEWYERLLANCQREGIIRNNMEVSKLVRYCVQLSQAETFNWCRLNGNYDLLTTMRAAIEDFVDVAPEYRKCK